jgi:hypothetical protein
MKKEFPRQVVFCSSYPYHGSMSGMEVKMFKKSATGVGVFRRYGVYFGLVRPKRLVRREGAPEGCGCESCL